MVDDPMTDKRTTTALNGLPKVVLTINERIRERKILKEGSSDKELLDHYRRSYIRVTNDPDASKTEKQQVLRKIVSLSDNIDGINNFIPQVLDLSNKCKNIRRGKPSLSKNPKKELSRLGLQGVFPETIQLPVVLEVPSEFRIKKASSGQLENQECTVNRGPLIEMEDNSVTVPLVSKNNGKRNANKRKKDEKDDDEVTMISSQTKKVGTVTPTTSFVAASEKLDEIESRYKRQELARNGIMTCRLEPKTACRQFVSPMIQAAVDDFNQQSKNRTSEAIDSDVDPNDPNAAVLSDPRLQVVEKELIQKILRELVSHDPQVTWDDIAGLESAKERIMEVVVYPMQNPGVFSGIRSPGKGVLLFGPPGTGKTMIGKCIASQAKATFFSITASTLTSKWIGEGEKLVRALFLVARVKQPSVIFIDEIDSLLLQRNNTDHEASTRIKTEFMASFDGLDCKDDDRLLVIGATNIPQGLDEAARRRFTKRLYIPLPDKNARLTIINNLLKGEKYDLPDTDKESISIKAEGYSGADMANLCKEAAMGPVRTAISEGKILSLKKEELRSINIDDFEEAMRVVKPSVSPTEIGQYEEFNKLFGAMTF